MSENAEGLGKPEGVGCGSSTPYDNQTICQLAALSPKSAWAKVIGAIPAPWTPNVVATFDTTSDTTASGDLDVTTLGADFWVTDIVFDIQCPSAFAGSTLKSMSDFFFNKTSGIAAKLNVTGRPRYDVAPNFTPLSNFCEIVKRSCCGPFGWLLTKYNSIHMDFQAQTPLPFAPLTVTVTFVGYQYVCAQIDIMSTEAALRNLIGMGYGCDYLLGRSASCDCKS